MEELKKLINQKEYLQIKDGISQYPTLVSYLDNLKLKIDSLEEPKPVVVTPAVEKPVRRKRSTTKKETIEPTDV